MPIYVYQSRGRDNCDLCSDPFERKQRIDDPRLQHCPSCGSPVRRVITAPHLVASGPDMSEKNLEKKGFTQYRKLEKGIYGKTAGTGPDIISDKD